mmetsp:Transcript_83898/g.237271  ORF Transcript_83898/g.237271 Transcript_83898/m.237271 type:complete len:523 (+) Transcript_83898:119-1687(+)
MAMVMARTRARAILLCLSPLLVLLFVVVMPTTTTATSTDRVSFLAQTVADVTADMSDTESMLGELQVLYRTGTLQHVPSSTSRAIPIGSNESDPMDYASAANMYALIKNQPISTMWCGVAFNIDHASMWVYGEAGNYYGGFPETWDDPIMGNITTDLTFIDYGDLRGCPLEGLDATCMCSFLLEEISGKPSKKPFSCYPYDPWSTTRPIRQARDEYNATGQGIWLNQELGLWMSMPFYAANVPIYDSEGEFIGMAQAGRATGVLETILAQKVSNPDDRLYIMTLDDEFNLVAASVPDVSYVEVDDWSADMTKVTSCVDDVIRRSGEHIINHTDTIGSDVSLVMGEFAIHTQVVESFSSKLGLQVPWLFVYVSRVICSSGQYLSMSDAQAGGNLMCKECKAPRTTSGAGALSCNTAVFGFFSDSGPESTSEAILDDYATECDEADGSPDKPSIVCAVPEGVVKKESLQIRNFELEKDYYRYSAHSVQVLPCKTKGSCIGGTHHSLKNESSGCSKAYTGALCNR